MIDLTKSKLFTLVLLLIKLDAASKRLFGTLLLLELLKPLWTSITNPNNDPIIHLKRGINSPKCAMIDIWAFDNYVLTDELFEKVSRGLRTYVSINNNYVKKFIPLSESLIPFDRRFKVASVPLFIPDFNLLSCK